MSSSASPTSYHVSNNNDYYIHLSDNVCNRLWAFERYPNKVLRGLDNAIIYTSNKEACLSACLNEVRDLVKGISHTTPFLQILFHSLLISLCVCCEWREKMKK